MVKSTLLGGPPHLGCSNAQQIIEWCADMCIVGNKMVIVVAAEKKKRKEHRVATYMGALSF